MFAQALASSLLIFVCICTIYPIRFRYANFTFNYVTAATSALLLLHFLDIVSLESMFNSVIASGKIQPWAVLIIFFTLAYSSISLDVTGFSKFTALTVLRKYAPRGTVSSGVQSVKDETETTRLAVIVYVLSGVIAVLASNDVVVLTLTPVIIHYCECIQVDPKPILLAEYFAANTFSAFLLVGNPTNIIIGQGMNLSFAKYVVLLFFPTVAFALCSLLSVKLNWCHGGTAASHKHEPSSAVSHKPTTNDVVVLIYCKESPRHGSDTCEEMDAIGAEATSSAMRSASDVLGSPVHVADDDVGDASLDPHRALVDPSGAKFGCVVLFTAIAFLAMSSYISIPLYAITSASAGLMFLRDCTVVTTEKLGDAKQPDLRRRSVQVLHRMPWDVAPFAIAMFILVNTMNALGVTEMVTSSVLLPLLRGGPLLASSAGYVFALLCMTLLNNQPGSIFFVSLLFPSATLSVEPLVARDAYAAFVISGILASNVGACFLPTGALAGIMWKSILDGHGVEMPFGYFVKAGFKVGALPVAVSGAVICIEAMYFISV